MKVLGQLENATLEILSADPGVSTAARMYYNTATSRFMLDDGTSKRALLRNDGRCVFGTSSTASENVRFHRGYAGVLQFVKGDDTTPENTYSLNQAQVSFRHENYTDAGKPASPFVNQPGRVIWVSDLAKLQVDNGTAWQDVVPPANTVTTAMIQDGAITQAKRAALNYQMSASSGTFQTTVAASVTNLSVTITTSGRPVILMLVADTTAGKTGQITAAPNGAQTNGFHLQYNVNGSALATYRIVGTFNTAETLSAPPYMHFEPAAAGTYTYSVSVLPQISNFVNVYDMKLVVYEL